MKILLISGGTADNCFLKELYRTEKYDCVIAADRGAEAAGRAGIPLDYLVGDFDSADRSTVEKYERMPDLKICRHRPEKDATDTELALELAIGLEPESITMAGATGTRLDHVLGNLYNLLLPLKKGIPCTIADPNNRICLLREGRVFRKEEAFGKYISFLPLTDAVEGITLRGFKYPLTNYRMEKGISIGVSNELQEEEASVEISSGILICVQSRD